MQAKRNQQTNSEVITELKRELCRMTRDRDENEQWRHRLHAQIQELEAQARSADGRSQDMAASLVHEWEVANAACHLVETRLAKLGLWRKRDTNIFSTSRGA
jgi:uncharacterized protein YigA (DUF484 family)